VAWNRVFRARLAEEPAIMTEGSAVTEILANNDMMREQALAAWR
jgi:hypothetical protein